MLRRSASVIYLPYLACPWRAGQKVKGQHRFLSELSSLLLTCHVPLTMRMASQATDGLLNVTLLIQRWQLFLLPPLTSHCSPEINGPHAAVTCYQF